MAIIVEDGSQVASSNSYASVDDLNTYADARGVELCVTDAEAEILLIKAMDYIEGKFSSKFQGYRTSDDQSLAFPRSGVWLDGVLVSADEIPRNLQYGQLAAAVEANSSDLLPNITPGIKRERVEGAVEVEYTNNGKIMAVSSFQKADSLLRPLCKAAGMYSVRT